MENRKEENEKEKDKKNKKPKKKQEKKNTKRDFRWCFSATPCPHCEAVRHIRASMPPYKVCFASGIVPTILMMMLIEGKEIFLYSIVSSFAMAIEGPLHFIQRQGEKREERRGI